MEREERNLHRKRDEKAQEEPLSRGGEVWHSSARDLIANNHEIKAASLCIQPEDSHQHEHGRDHRIQKEFHRRVYLALVAEHPDQQRHGNQRRFPEEIEQEQIERSEDADQRGFQNQQNDEEFFNPVMDRFPRDQHAQRRQERGKQHQPQRNAVDTHVVVDVGAGNPLLVDVVLESGLRPMKINRKMQRKNKREQRKDQRKNANVTVAAWEQNQQQRPGQRGKRHQRQNVRAPAVGVHRAPVHSQIM